MKTQIRRGVFETNSSSIHSLTMCSQSEYDKWKSGDLVWNRWYDRLENASNVNLEEDEDREYLTYDQFFDWDYIEYETFEQKYTTPSGDKVVAFGYYGYD